MPNDKCIDKASLRYAYKEYYSALKGKEILSCSTLWLKLEAIICEIKQSQKEKYQMIPSICYPKKSDSEDQMVEWWLPGFGGVAVQ